MLLLRVAVGAGMTYHGAGKVFGGSIPQFAEGVGKMGFPLPLLFAWLAALSEFAGGICLILGLGTRLAALFVSFTMLVAAFLAHKAHLQLLVALGLFSASPDEIKSWGKPELALAYLAASLAILLMGGGRFSLDKRLFSACPFTRKGDEKPPSER